METWVIKWKGDYSGLRGSMSRFIKAINKKAKRKYPKHKKYVLK